MGDALLLRPRGMMTAPSRLSEAPSGAMETANNCLMRLPGVLESRRYFTQVANSLSSSGKALGLYCWVTGGNEYLVAATNASKVETHAIPFGWAGSWTALTGTYAAPDSTYAQTRFVESKSNLYFSSSTGVFRMVDATTTPALSGIPAPLSATVQSASTAGNGCWLDDPASLAYRATITFEDAQGNWLESAPCGRAIYRKTSGSAEKPTVRVYLPKGLTTSYKVRLYRSKTLAATTGEPSDAMGLVYERFLTSTETATNYYAEIEDVTPDALVGPLGYFTPEQEGIGQSNERPPLAWDICWHGNRMLYANTTSKHRIQVRLLAVASSATTPNFDGLQADDDFAIGAQVFTAKASPGSSTEFAVVSTNASAQTNIEETAKSLVNTINLYNAGLSTPLYYAKYISGADDPAGMILIEEAGIGGSAFALSADDGGVAVGYWAPALPISGTTVESDNDRRKNRVYISKDGQPEAVPLLSYVDVGSANDSILRIAALRDSVFVWKQFDGLYRITGVGSGEPTVQLFDPTVKLTAPSSVASLGNELYALTNQGVVAVSDAGVRIVSGPIQDFITNLIPFSSNGQYAPGAALEDEHLYILAANLGNVILTYSVPDDCWTRWTDMGQTYSFAVSQMTGHLFYGPSASNVVRGQNKTASSFGYANSNYTHSADSSFSVKWVLNEEPAPAKLKHWTHVEFFFDSDSTATTYTATITSDLDTTGETVTLPAIAAGQPSVTCPVPQQCARATTLSITLSCAQASVRVALLGCAIHYTETSERGRRS